MLRALGFGVFRDLGVEGLGFRALGFGVFRLLGLAPLQRDSKTQASSFRSRRTAGVVNLPNTLYPINPER